MNWQLNAIIKELSIKHIHVVIIFFQILKIRLEVVNHVSGIAKIKSNFKKPKLNIKYI